MLFQVAADQQELLEIEVLQSEKQDSTSKLNPPLLSDEGSRNNSIMVYLVDSNEQDSKALLLINLRPANSMIQLKHHT
jgi:hypothetical protein